MYGVCWGVIVLETVLNLIIDRQDRSIERPGSKCKLYEPQENGALHHKGFQHVTSMPHESILAKARFAGLKGAYCGFLELRTLPMLNWGLKLVLMQSSKIRLLTLARSMQGDVRSRSCASVLDALF